MNWIGIGRTNYFRVKDVEAFRKEARAAGLEVYEQYGSANPAGTQRTGYLALGAEEGWPSTTEAPKEGDPRGDAEIEFDIVDFVQGHLIEGEVAIIMEGGFEGMRYVDGWATAVNSAGEMKTLSLISGILELARTLGTNEVTHPSY